MKNNITVIMAAALFLFVFSCTNKEWDDHYSSSSHVDENLFDFLSGNPEYKTFVDLIVKAKCDTVIKRGNQYTVFALTNDAAASLANMDGAALRAAMEMHIAPATVYLNRMNNTNTPAISGKSLRFKNVSGGYTVNDIAVKSEMMKTSNGLVYRIEKPIASLPNLYDVIATDPDLTLFKKFIDDNMYQIADPDNNVLVGYDTLNIPIYGEPVNYIHYSEFLMKARPDDETVISTAFFPSDAFIRRALDNLLAARGGRQDMIAPGLRKFTQDTLVAGRYFRSGRIFRGDTALLLDRIYTHVVVRGEIPSLSSDGIFTNIANERLAVSPTQVKGSVHKASNGYYYIMDDVDVPGLFFRSEFWLTPYIKTAAASYTSNPAVTFFNTAYLESFTSTAYCHTLRYALYNCRTTGGGINFKWPFVTAGSYKVLLSYFSSDYSGVFDVAYGPQLVTKDLVTGSYYNLRMLLYVVKELGTIHVAADGSVEIRFTCTNVRNNPRGQEDSFKICVDYLMLQPVDN